MIGRMQGFRLIVAFGLFAAMLLAGSGRVSAQIVTYNYSGPSFDYATCVASYGGAPGNPCVNGNVTGSATFVMPAGGTGTVTYADGSMLAFSLIANGGGVSLSQGSCYQDTYNLNLTSGSATGWSFSPGNGDYYDPGSPYCEPDLSQIESGYAATWSGQDTFDRQTGVTGVTLAVGWTTTGGFWTNTKALGAPCDQPGAVSCGNPISISTGNKFEQVADYETTGQNKLGFTRYYNSMATPDTYAITLGKNWRSNYDRYLNVNLALSSYVSVERPDGQVIGFTLVSGVWTPDTDVDYTLTNSGTTWTLTDANDTVETYTAAAGKGTLNTIKLRNGYTQTMNYTSGVLTSVTDSYSRTLTLAYTSGLLHTVTTPDSLVLTYGYSTVAGANLLTSVSYNTSPVTSQTYLYENVGFPFALTGITDEDGNRYATWAYDGTGRAVSSQHGTGTTTDGLTTVSYDDTTGNRTVTGPLGIQETYKFTTLQGVPKVNEIDRAANGTVAAATRTFGYDTNGYLNAATDWNTNSTTYVNNAHGDPTTINEAVGAPVARTTTIVYDTTWVHLPHTVTTPGTTTTNNYDATTGNLLTRVLTDTTTTSIPYSTNGQTRTWTYTWTATGQLLTARLPRLDVVAKTTFGYTGGVLTSITDALSHVTTINTYKPGGLPLTITDPNSVLTTLAYDARLRLHTNVLTTGAGNLTTTYDHDAAGNLTKVTLPDASYLSYGYDNAHRLDLITNRLNETQNLTLDAMGNVTQTLWENASAVVTRQHSATYDALGRKLTDVGGMSQTTTLGYDSQGNTTSITAPLTWATGQAFDALNRLTTITDPYTNTTVTTYDAHNRPLTVTDPNGHATTFVYDGFGEAIQQINPDAGRTIYHYDVDGNNWSKSDAASAVTNATFDALDRILTRTYPADTSLNVAFTYDQTTGHGDGVGRLTSLTDQAGSLSRSYDERGNLLTDARTIGTTVYTPTYTYDNASRVKTITYPTAATAGWLVTYSRDTTGQVASIQTTQPGHTAVQIAPTITHEPFGPEKSLTWGNGVTDARTFDLDYRMTTILDSTPSALQNLTYGYDADNNVHTITDAVTAANSQTLGYDHLDRLLSAVSGTGGYGSLSYTYDNNGNRKTDGATTYTIASTSNRVTAIGATSVGYIATGNINAIGANTMTYNKANQLATATVAGTASTYTYDAFGARLLATVGAGTPSVEQYDQLGNFLMETNSGVETDYVYLDGMPVAAIQPAAATISYVNTDQLGTPQKATNAAKATVWNTTYQPFGATGTITGSITQNLRLPGQYADATAYNHNGFRDYNPVMGRYLEADPIGLAGGLNPYAYVGSNPAKWTDRTGLQEYDPSVENFLATQDQFEPQGISYGPNPNEEMVDVDIPFPFNHEIHKTLDDISTVLDDAQEFGEDVRTLSNILGNPAVPHASAAPLIESLHPTSAQCSTSNPTGIPQFSSGPFLENTQ